MPTPSVQLDQVSRHYGNVKAVDNVSLSIEAGEFFTLLGSSGSGKTTSLRLIAGFELPDLGRVLINGHDVSKTPAYRRNVHTVFQDYALFPHLTVQENVSFALDLKGLNKTQSAQMIGNALELVQLNGFENRKPTQLSGGQQQRVALARAIVDRPAVLLLDEPLSALDAKIRAELREELKRLQRETRITFVYVTHDQEEALTLSDRMAVMRGGRILQCGTPFEIYERPADLFVAEFVGKANFISGRLVGLSDNRARIQTGDQTVEAMSTCPLNMGDTVRVMVRPENLVLGETGFRGQIVLSQFLGHSTEYMIKSGGNIYRAHELRRRGAIPRSEGTTVGLSWKWDEALVYPQEG
jgi:spermidine/putrescine transport system ATP-binding protein